jgi:hypothetical protein
MHDLLQIPSLIFGFIGELDPAEFLVLGTAIGTVIFFLLRRLFIYLDGD